MNTWPPSRRKRLLGLGIPLVLLAATVATAQPQRAGLPAVNLTVQVRVADEGELNADAAPASYTVGTRREAEATAAPVSLSVMNGQWANLRLARSVPVQWMQAGVLQGAAGAASGAAPGAGGRFGGGVVNAVTWMDAGQGLAVRVRWPGGGRPAAVELRLDRAGIDPRDGAALPAARHTHAGTRLLVPLGRWVSFAAVNAGAVPTEATGAEHGSRWSTAAPAGGRRLMQVRVSAS